MRLLVSVRSDIQDAWYGCVLAHFDKETVQSVFATRELHQMVKSKEPTLDEMTFMGLVLTDFFEDPDFEELLNEKEWEQYERDEFLVLPEGREIGEKFGTSERTELDSLVIDERGMFFRAFPKHMDCIITSEVITFDQLLEWSKADG